MTREMLCPADRPTVLVRNTAARGLARTFVLRTAHAAPGSVEVRSGALPFFIGAGRRVLPLADGMTIARGFWDASFEIAVTPSEAVNVRLE
jgi:hypothetical protein